MSDILKPLREMVENWNLREYGDTAEGAARENIVSRLADELSDLLPALEEAIQLDKHDKEVRYVLIDALEDWIPYIGRLDTIHLLSERHRTFSK